MTAKRWTDDKLRALLAEHESGVSAAELADRYGMAHRVMHRLLAKAGRPKRAERPRKIDSEPPPEMVKADLIRRNARALKALRAEARRSRKQRNVA